jgi:CBS domain-containing protein
MVTRSDLLGVAPADEAGTTLGEAFACEVVAVAPTDTAIDALHRMLDEEVEHLPVIDHGDNGDGGRMVGICTRTDILKARRKQRHAELPQAGWLRLRQVSSVGSG